MANMSIRNIPDADLKALKRIAARHGRSAEAEVRQVIAEHVHREGVGVGTYLHRRYGGLLADDIEFARERTPAQPIDLR